MSDLSSGDNGKSRREYETLAGSCGISSGRHKIKVRQVDHSFPGIHLLLTEYQIFFSLGNIYLLLSLRRNAKKVMDLMNSMKC
jgi:hypothetical protein